VTRFAQNRPQLLAQLRTADWPVTELSRASEAHALLARVTSGVFRPSGKTHVAHAVGTASILAWLDAAPDLVVAGLLHSVYRLGDFGDGAEGPTRDRRARLCDVVGERAEDHVARYHHLPWSARRARDHLGRTAALDDETRRVLLLRIANHLEDHLDLGILYCADGEGRLRATRSEGRVLVELAREIGEPRLAAALDASFEECRAARMPLELRCAYGWTRDRTLRHRPDAPRARTSRDVSQRSSCADEP
jgi:(p)ppGpp synthase/HD superfamily hydrolase